MEKNLEGDRIPERAGRELNILVAKEVMGHSVVKQKNGLMVEGTPTGVKPLREYSSHMEAAWEVAVKLGITLIPVQGGQWFALVGNENGWNSPADFMKFLQTADFVKAGAAVCETGPLAICLAAVKTIENRRKLVAEGADSSMQASATQH